MLGSSIAALSGALLVGPLHAEAAETCDRLLKIDGRPEDVSALRQALSQSSLHASAEQSCRDTSISLRGMPGGYSIELAVGNARVEREVASIAAAATWVEGWIADPPPSQPATVDAPAEPSAASAAPAPPRAAPAQSRDRAEPPAPPQVIYVQPGAQLALLAMAGAGNDGSAWGAGEVFARLQVTPTWWMGAALGFERDTALVGPADDLDGTSRMAIRASGRGGARLPISSALDAVLGAGVGVTWGMTMRSFGNDDEDIDHGGFFVEGLADTSWRVSERLSLLAGLGARGRMLSVRATEDATERILPDAMPVFTGELRLGAGWDFGGTQ